MQDIELATISQRRRRDILRPITRQRDHAHFRNGSSAVPSARSCQLKSVAAVPPIPGMTVMDWSTYASCHF